MAKAGRGPGSSPSVRPRPYAGPAAVILLAFAAYANSLGNGFTYDDRSIVLGHPAVLEEHDGRPVPWYQAWFVPYWPETNRRTDLDVLYRPFTLQTYAWDMRFLGPNGGWFHLVNVALHALVSVGVWWLGRRLAESPAAGVVAGCVFAVHPIHTEAVANIVGRAEILAAAGMLGALYALDRTLSTSGRGRVALWALAAALAAAIAMFSKESGVAVVPTTAAFAWWRWRADGHPRTHWLRAGPMLAIMLLIFAAYLSARYHVCGNRFRVDAQIIGSGNVLHQTSGLPRALTPLSLFGRYVGLMLWPGRLLADYSYAVVTPTTSPAEPFFVLGVIALALVVAEAIRSCRGTGATFVTITGWAATYVLVSNSLVLIAIMMAERWFYGPSLWLTVLVVVAVHQRLRTRVGEERRRRWAAAAWPRVLFAIALLALCARTWVRNPDWRDLQTLFEHDLHSLPPGRRSVHVLGHLSTAYLAQGRLKEAEALAREAAQTAPENPQAQAALGNVLVATGRAAEAVPILTEALRMTPHNVEIRAALDRARSRAAGIDVDASLQQALAAVAKNPADPEAHYAAGRFLEDTGDFAAAVEHFKRAAEIRPDDRAAWLGWARSLAAASRPEEAVDVYDRILARWPGADGWEAHANIALQLMNRPFGKLYQPDRAVRHAEQALELGPADMKVQLTLNLAEVCANCGRLDRAIRLFEEVQRQLPPDDPQRGRLQERIDYWRKQR